VSDSGSTSEVSAMVMVGSPSPTSPFTVPAIKNTASASRMASVVMQSSVVPSEAEGPPHQAAAA
jgi:hypothetical protein